MKIVIVGPGAMGCLFGGFLSLSGQEVWFLDKDPQRAQVLQEQGISIEGISGEHKAQVKASSDPEDIGRPDLVIICVKSYDTFAAVQNISGLAASNTPVITLQNGLGNAEIISQSVGAQKTLAGVTSQGATLLNTGRIRHAGQGPTVIGWVKAEEPGDDFNQDLILKEIVRVFKEAGFQIKTADKVEDFIWSKLIINVGINALTAVTRLNNGRLIDFKGTRDIMRKAVEEALTVVSAKGIKLTFDPIIEVEKVCKATAGNVASMLQDVLKERRTEIEAINGAIVREAEKLNLSVPINKMLTDLVKTIENSYELRVKF